MKLKKSQEIISSFVVQFLKLSSSICIWVMWQMKAFSYIPEEFTFSSIFTVAA